MLTADKEAFDKWWDKVPMGHKITHDPFNHTNIAWQAACEYKQKEIDELNSYVKFQSEVMCYMGEVVLENKNLQAENAKLREALLNCPILGEVHRDSNDRFKEWNLEYKYVLKELEDK